MSLFFQTILTSFYLTLSLVYWSCNAQKSIPIEANSTVAKPVEANPTEVMTTRVGALHVLDTFVHLDYVMGKFEPANHALFTEIPIKYADITGRYLRKDVLEAYLKMYEAAKKDGINLIIKSATRNFANQKRIWENKWNGITILEGNINAAKDIKDPVTRALKILEYSSMPGSSRHHWGTDLDINNFTNEWFAHGEGLQIYTWMQANAANFGFCQPYSKMGSDRNSGYYEEKWHWTYMPISTILTDFAKHNLKNEMIDGFKGSKTAVEVDIVHNFVLGISPSCK